MGCYKIFLGDCASNAFISKRENGDTDCFLSFEELEEYGHRVWQELNERNLEAECHFSRDLTEAFFEENEEFFFPMTVNGKNGVGVDSRKTKSELIRQYRGYLPLDLLLAYCSVGHDMYCKEDDR